MMLGSEGVDCKISCRLERGTNHFFLQECENLYLVDSF